MSKPKLVNVQPADKLKVALCQPCRVARPGYVHDVQNLVMYTMRAAGDLLELGVLVEASTYIHKGRNNLVAAALKAGVTHVLFLDDDMRFPKDTLGRLLAHRVPVVGANYVTRGVDVDLGRPRPLAVKDGGKLVYTREDSTGLEEVEGLGTGVMLIEASQFAKVSFPWFETYYDKQGRHHGEDYDFCAKVRKAGGRVFVDHDLSKAVRHVGEFEYNYQMALPDEEVA
jgi:hypothetical protein